MSYAIVFTEDGRPSYSMDQHDLVGYVEHVTEELGQKAGIVHSGDAHSSDFQNYYHNGTMLLRRPSMGAAIDKLDVKAGGNDYAVLRIPVAPVVLKMKVLGASEPLLAETEVDDADIELAFDTPGIVRVRAAKFPYMDFVIDVSVVE